MTVPGRSPHESRRDLDGPAVEFGPTDSRVLEEGIEKRVHSAREASEGFELVASLLVELVDVVFSDEARCLGRGRPAHNGNGDSPGKPGSDDAASQNVWSDVKQTRGEHLGAGGSTREHLILDATNRRGRPIRAKVTITPLVNPEGSTLGVIILINPVTPDQNAGH